MFYSRSEFKKSNETLKKPTEYLKLVMRDLINNTPVHDFSPK